MKKRDPSMADLRQVVLAGANDETVLVGGMAVSFLADSYGVRTGEPCMTTDADFFGESDAVERSEELLQQAGFTTKKRLATLDDQNTPNSGTLSVEISPNVRPIQIDFLARIDGLSNDEIIRSAVGLAVQGSTIKVEHPALLLENKIMNLALYPTKRTEFGVNQARLAVAILKRFLEGLEDQRRLLSYIERIGRFARREAAAYAFTAYGIDVLDTVPLESVIAPEFKTKRWPQIQEETRKRYAKFESIWERSKASSDFRTRRFSG